MKYEWICIAHTGVFCAHFVGSVTVVELNFVTLIRPESERSEPLEGVLETEDDFPAASLTEDFVVECALAVRDALLVDGFNGLDVGFLPDECSAKEQCIVERWLVCTANLNGVWLIDRHAEKAVFKLRSQSGLFTHRGLRCQCPHLQIEHCKEQQVFVLAHRLPCRFSSPFSNHWLTSHYLLFSYDQSLPLRQLDDIIPAWLYTSEHSLP